MAIEIRPFGGDPDELGAFITRNWRIHYAKDGYAPTVKGDFFRWMMPTFAGGDPGSIIAAYDGAKLVGVMPSEPTDVTLMGSPARIHWTEYTTVDSERQRSGIGRLLRDGLQIRSNEIGVVLRSGFVNSPLMAGKGRAFWTSMGDRSVLVKHPRPWVRILDGAAVAAGVHDAVTRAASRLGGILGTSGKAGYRAANVRPYRATDRPACHRVFVEYMRGLDLAYNWTEDRLGRHLEMPGFVSTLVAHDNAGTINGFATCYIFEVMGKQPMRHAIIDMIAPDDRRLGDKVELLASAVAEVKRDGAQLVVTLGPPVAAAATLILNRFVPMHPTYDLLLHLFRPEPRVKDLRRAFAVFR